MTPRAEVAFCFLIAGWLFSASAAAAPATVGPIVISIPEGFEAAPAPRHSNRLIAAWTKSVHDGSMKTLLQVDVVDLGQHASPSAQELSIYAEKYLRQFLGEIGRRRSQYVSSPVAHVRLAGLPAVRATWNGAIAGRAVVGVMYSVMVLDRFAVILHTQDLGSTPSSGMSEAMGSIESLRVISPPRDP